MEIHTLSHAQTIGRSHRIMQQNCHDFVQTGTPDSGKPPPTSAFGLVLDGCGSKHRDEDGATPSHNEIGAKLLGQFIANYLHRSLPDSQLTNEFFERLYAHSIGFYQSLLHSYSFDDAGRRRFIGTNLLCTILGFVVVEDTAVFFHRGDGYLLHDNEIIHLDNDNQPDYLAYDLDGQNGLPTNVGINTHTIHNPTRLAVATDGWTAELLTQLDHPQPSLTLQRWLNIQAKQRGNFEDDGAIAIWWNPS